ncbi:CMRF35-like molecule 7 [Melanotaenia boesemani]|uniref:CMRF35-like molecule 7 n=1 Tax=Melanotaenia boesemani TaxID=1250792 RepID=UPI001C05C961|nr:CMRF35-like molecule 7 [Melanotaenia boesemani]
MTRKRRKPSLDVRYFCFIFVLFSHTMKTARIFVSLFNALVLSLLLLPEHNVTSAQLSAPDEVTGPLSGSVTISCQYDLKFQENTKYWCKGPIYDFCKIVVKTPRNRPNSRSSIVDTGAGVFTVTMTLLTESDEDTYWCVIARGRRNVHKGVKLFISKTVTIPSSTTESNLLLKVAELERDWWAILRWILFFIMLGCLASTHIAVWWIKAARSM